MMTYPSRGYELVLILDLALRARVSAGCGYHDLGEIGVCFRGDGRFCSAVEALGEHAVSSAASATADRHRRSGSLRSCASCGSSASLRVVWRLLRAAVAAEVREEL